MYQNKFSSRAGKIFVLVISFGLLFSTLNMPNTTVVTAQEPTPTDDVSGQIVGGAPATAGEWPWQVALIDGSYVGTDFWASQFCGGSLISPQWVVTAAHCVYGDAASAVDIIAGIYDLSSPAVGYQRRDISQIIIHPSYNNSTFDFDIALLQLASAVTIGGSGETKTALIPLASSTLGDLAGTTSWVTGWGNTESVPLWPTQLYEVDVPIISNSLCNDAGHYNGDITSNMLCAGYEAGGKDSCAGDSGGPLVVSNGGIWKLAGIVSWGDGCADPAAYGVYTRISNFQSWIDNYVPVELAVNAIDVYPPNILLDPNIYVNDDVTVEIETQNIGAVDSAGFTVNIYEDGTPVITSCIVNDPAREYYADSTGLLSGEKEYWTITIPAGTFSVGSHTITVYMDSDCEISELDENDNILAATFTVGSAPASAPANDSVSTPTVITDASLPYAPSVLDVRGATRHATDPDNISCPLPPPDDLDAGLASVWYRYVPSADTDIYLDTFGSNYDTYIAVWQGTMPGGTLVGCNDDSAGNTQSVLQVSLTSGNTYYFEVAEYSNDITSEGVNANSLDKSGNDVEAQAGGGLQLHVYALDFQVFLPLIFK